MNHLDLYIYLKYGTHYETILNDLDVIDKFNREYDENLNIQQIEDLYRDSPATPRTVQVVRRLAQMGFSNKTIGKWLSISPSTISIHLHNENVKEYKNFRLSELQRAKEKRIQENIQTW